jgi:SAM-dependent methyltransferase
VASGERVLDVGCGTGNASLAAARRGAIVTGVDPAPRLVEVATRRAADEGLRATFSSGNATDLPFETGSFDAALSVFALIFADDAERASGEIARVVRPGGRIVLTTWRPIGPVHEVGRLVRNAAVARNTELGVRSAPAWGEAEFVRKMFEGRGRVTLTERLLPIRAASADAWLADLLEHHPVWRAVGRLVGPESAAWRDVCDASLRILREGNEDPAAFCVTSRYFVVRIDLHE